MNIKVIPPEAATSNLYRTMKELGETDTLKVCKYIVEGRLRVTDYCKRDIERWFEKRTDSTPDQEWLLKGLNNGHPSLCLYIDRDGAKRLLNELTHDQTEREVAIVQEIESVKHSIKSLETKVEAILGKLDGVMDKHGSFSSEVLARLNEIELVIKEGAEQNTKG